MFTPIIEDAYIEIRSVSWLEKVYEGLLLDKKLQSWNVLGFEGW